MGGRGTEYLDTLRQHEGGHRGLGALAMEPENEEVSLRYILKYSTRGGSNIYQHFVTSEETGPTSWQTEKDGWIVRERTVHSKRAGKTSGNDIEYQGVLWRKPRRAPRGP